MLLGNVAGCENDESAELIMTLEPLSGDAGGSFEDVLLKGDWRGLKTDPVGRKCPLTVNPGEWLLDVGSFGRTN